MSRIITNTNIIVDDFDFCKSFPKDTFVHFLTHFHADHYEGLTPLWDYGEVYCTHQTKEFILENFPKLGAKGIIHGCNLNEKYSILIGHGELRVDFYMFDAKHTPGSAMILF